MARDTVLGRLSLLSRTGRILLVGGIVLTALALAASVMTLRGGESSRSKENGAPREPGLLPDELGDLGGLGGVPQRIEPSPPAGSSGAGRAGDRAGERRSTESTKSAGSAGGAGSAARSSSPDPRKSREAASGTTAPSAGGTAGTAGAGGREPGRTGRDVQRPVYTAWAGPGCSGGGRYQEHGRYQDGDEGWYTRWSGGHRGDGCDGRFSALPMSGHDDSDGGGWVAWSWYVGSGFHWCDLTVVVPRAERGRDVAGDPSVYQVRAARSQGGGLLRSFAVDQVAQRGKALRISRVGVSDEQVTVRLLDRGRDWGEGREGAHHAAAQMRLECRAS
ncbi:adhesin [Streptomyces sp. NPDC000594]|uniref:adhesin n=1 Tax=Streptomyces sp. NPDC000594 TaxID=3154261 RepID=UPI003318149A